MNELQFFKIVIRFCLTKKYGGFVHRMFLYVG